MFQDQDRSENANICDQTHVAPRKEGSLIEAEVPNTSAESAIDFGRYAIFIWSGSHIMVPIRVLQNLQIGLFE